mgnify:CR=1 FL=1
MMLICSVPNVTPVMPPMKPKRMIEKIIAEKPGSPHGAFTSHSNIPLV